MDIITHAITGAITGATFGHPLAGSIGAVVPDIVLGIKRKVLPTTFYKVNHSVITVAAVAQLATYLQLGDAGLAFAWGWVSHLALDIPTHGKTWSPRLLYPLSDKGFKQFDEWEFFSESWWLGLYLAILWSLVWAMGIRSTFG